MQNVVASSLIRHVSFHALILYNAARAQSDSRSAPDGKPHLRMFWEFLKRNGRDLFFKVLYELLVQPPIGATTTRIFVDAYHLTDAMILKSGGEDVRRAVGGSVDDQHDRTLVDLPSIVG